MSRTTLAAKEIDERSVPATQIVRTSVDQDGNALRAIDGWVDSAGGPAAIVAPCVTGCAVVGGARTADAGTSTVSGGSAIAAKGRTASAANVTVSTRCRIDARAR